MSINRLNFSYLSRAKSAPLLGVSLDGSGTNSSTMVDPKFPLEKTFFFDKVSTTSSDSSSEERNRKIAKKLSEVLSKNKKPVFNQKKFQGVGQKQKENLQNGLNEDDEKYLLNWKEQSSGD